MSTNISAGLNIAQAGEIANSDALFSRSINDDFDVTRDKEPKFVGKNKLIGSNFNYWAIIAAALVFIIVIAWFESIRVWVEYIYLIESDETHLLRKRANAHMAYAVLATVLGIILLFLIVNLEFL